MFETQSNSDPPSGCHFAILGEDQQAEAELVQSTGKIVSRYVGISYLRIMNSFGAEFNFEESADDLASC